MTGALAALKALPERARGRIYAKINALADAPRPRGSKMPEDTHDFYRIRAGEYRRTRS